MHYHCPLDQLLTCPHDVMQTSQMVGLYKDPDGKDITFETTTQRDGSSMDTETRGGSEMRELRRRVIELENSLIQHVSTHYQLAMVYWLVLYCGHYCRHR